jgi:predicted nucleotidyltransferase component of viral defense system
VSAPNRQTTAGRAYLDLRNLAKKSGRLTEELLVLYALEGFLDRLSRSSRRDLFVLKGGVLLAAYDSRRATRDIDFAARAINNDAEVVMSLVAEIMSESVDDGIIFATETLSAQTIREDGEYAGVRVTARASLSTASLYFHLDINIGDMIWPGPSMVSLPRLLGTDPIRILGYPITMILAEKIVTAMQRGTANTRWRDFVDIGALLGTDDYDAAELRRTIELVAQDREVTIRPLAETLAGYPELAQNRWEAWRRNQRLESTTPESFSSLIKPIIETVDRLVS